MINAATLDRCHVWHFYAKSLSWSLCHTLPGATGLRVIKMDNVLGISFWKTQCSGTKRSISKRAFHVIDLLIMNITRHVTWTDKSAVPCMKGHYCLPWFIGAQIKICWKSMNPFMRLKSVETGGWNQQMCSQSSKVLQMALLIPQLPSIGWGQNDCSRWQSSSVSAWELSLGAMFAYFKQCTFKSQRAESGKTSPTIHNQICLPLERCP